MSEFRDDDRGELTMAVFVHRDCVVVDFCGPVTWIGMDKDRALQFAAMITSKANELPDVEPTTGGES